MVHSFKESGFALISSLLIVALVAIIASSMIADREVEIARAGYIQDHSQASATFLGVDQWVRRILARDQKGSEVDHLSEAWAAPLVNQEHKGLILGGRLRDAQSKMNINNLSSSDEGLQAFWVEYFERLLLSQNLPLTFSGAIKDWIDRDDEISPNGMESGHYLQKPTPYRAGNLPIVTLQELIWVDGMSSRTINTLSEWVTALPVESTINVNTSSAFTLSLLSEQIPATVYESWVGFRGQSPAQSLDDFYSFIAVQSNMDESELKTVIPERALSVGTKHFFLESHIGSGLGDLSIHALYHRGEQGASLIYKMFN